MRIQKRRIDEPNGGFDRLSRTGFLTFFFEDFLTRKSSRDFQNESLDRFGHTVVFDVAHHGVCLGL